jgi:hypothetical protein
LSAELDFKALLDADSAVAALVGERGVSMHEIPPGLNPPYIVFTSQADPQQMLSGEGEDVTTFSCGCWADRAHIAGQVADAVVAAINAYDAASTSVSVTYLSRSPVYDEETGLDGVLLSIEWFP